VEEPVRAADPADPGARVTEAIALSQRGERDAGRAALSALWDEIGPAGDPYLRCGIAHSMADLQEHVPDELAWDLRALVAADALSDERAAEAGLTTGVAGLYPSLYLNVADCYRRLGDLDRARAHLVAGQRAAAALGDDGYAAMIRGGLARLEARLGAAH
jgi:hypothetical protein